MKIKFTTRQLDKTADIFVGLGHLFFGSLVIPYLIPKLDKPSFVVLLFGLEISVALWLSAIKIVEK